MDEDQLEQFTRELEIDFAISEAGLGRFRVNVFHQRGNVAMVLRYITSELPTLDELGMPEQLKDLIMLRRGLILMVGATGCGKSTTLAAMVNHRNEKTSSHIITIEDPIEFLHSNKKSIVNQREVGLDTKSYGRALKSAMRAAPDVIQIGEIRDTESMQAALDMAGTGHLVSARCTRTMQPKRWTESSTCSRRNSMARCSWTWRIICARSFRNDSYVHAAASWSRQSSSCSIHRTSRT